MYVFTRDRSDAVLSEFYFSLRFTFIIMEADTQPGEPHRIEALWFEDGNIVLRAGNALYRVYRGTLATHSPVFKDILSFPQPPDSKPEVIDGCPVTNLPDPEVEVTPFLKALF